jgi:hypothetical protein
VLVPALHSAASNFTESNLMSYDSAESSSMHRVWWAENSGDALAVNGISVLDDQTHTLPDVVGGAGDTSGSITLMESHKTCWAQR